MKRVYVIFAGESTPWIAIENGAIAERGDDYSEHKKDENDPCVLIVPAHRAALHACDLPDLASPQAQAAARHVLAEKSLLSPEQLVVACGEQRQGDPPRIVALAAAADILGWVNDFDPDVILPAPLILPRPETGFFRGIFPHETILRGAGTGFAEDDCLAAILIGDAAVETLDRSALESAIVAAAIDPPLNLRSGDYAKRRSPLPDKAWVRQMALLGIAILGVTLVIPLVETARLTWQTATLEKTSAALAQAALGESVPPENAIYLLDRRLSGLRGAGAGFANTTAAVMRAIAATANVELVQMDFTEDGTMRVSVRATSRAEIEALCNTLRGAGLDVILGPVNSSLSQPLVDIQVRGR